VCLPFMHDFLRSGTPWDGEDAISLRLFYFSTCFYRCAVGIVAAPAQAPSQNPEDFAMKVSGLLRVEDSIALMIAR
jgi:hypothetical protein